MGMPGRKFSGSSYRYGFNSKENDNDIKGEGNQQDYGMRIYDPRVAKFLSVDPLTKSYPNLTPYQFSSNSPIAGIDIDGGEFRSYTIIKVEENGKTKLQIGEYRGQSDIGLALKARVALTKGVGPFGLIPVEIEIPISFDFHYSDVGINADIVDVNGSLRVLPQGIDWCDLPSLDDPIWEGMETPDEFRDRIVSDGNNLIQSIKETRSVWLAVRGKLKSNTQSGQSLGVKNVNLDPPRERAKRLRQLAKGRLKHPKAVVKQVWEKAKKEGGGVSRKSIIILIIISLNCLGLICVKTKETNKMDHEKLNEYLLASVRMGELENVKRFLSEGADINYRDEFNDDALYYAVTKQQPEIFEYLRKNGAHINSTYGNKRNLLQIAIRTGCEKKGNFAITKTLIEAVGDLNYLDAYGNTALHYACVSYVVNMKTIELLLLKKSDMNIVNNSGISVYNSAKMYKRVELLQILNKYK